MVARLLLHAARSPGGMEEFSRPLRLLNAMGAVSGQVDNGGFHQLYFNGYEPFLDDAIEGFRAAGLADHAAILEEVREPAGREAGLRGEVRETGTLAAFGESYARSDLGQFDRRWYALPPIYNALDAFVVANAPEIWEDA